MSFNFDFLKKKRMSDSDLAQAMLDWQTAREALDVLEDAIKKEVLARQKTFQAGSVRATFGKGRKSYDYESAVRAVGKTEDDLQAYAKTTYDWRMAAKDMELKDIPFTQGEPYVSMRIVE